MYKNLATGILSHILSVKEMDTSFTEESTHLITTSEGLRIVGPNHNYKWGTRHRVVSGLY